MTSKPTPIGIAVVEHDNRFLIGIRGNDVPLAGYAEFPGGKCHSGETPQQCALRECAEETGLEVQLVELLLNRSFTYDHDSVDLHFWLCHPAEAESVEDNHQGFSWVTINELAELKFPDANQPVIELLSARNRTSC